MAVFSVAAWRAHPGRLTELIQVGTEARKIHERLGGSVGLVQEQSAGPDPGTLYYSVGFETTAALGRWSDALRSDDEWPGVLARAYGADAPGVMVGQAIAVEVAGFERGPAGPPPGTFVHGGSFRAHPGRDAEAMDLMREIFELAGNHGARACRLITWMMAGPGTWSYYWRAEYANATEWGAGMDSMAADPRFPDLFQRFVRSTDSPMHSLTQATGIILPI